MGILGTYKIWLLIFVTNIFIGLLMTRCFEFRIRFTNYVRYHLLFPYSLFFWFYSVSSSLFHRFFFLFPFLFDLLYLIVCCFRLFSPFDFRLFWYAVLNRSSTPWHILS